MKQIRKILVPVDFSEASTAAFRYALWFADKYESEIELLHLVSPELVPMDVPVISAKATSDRVKASEEVMKIFVQSSLVQAQTAHQLENVPVIRENIEVGLSMNLVSQIARKKEVDLIIMGTKGEHAGLIRFFGSTATSTIDNAPCPVLVVPESPGFEKIKNIAYATDLSDADAYHIWDLGKLLSPFHPIIRVVHIMDDDDESKSVDMQDLEDFFEGHAPGLIITFHSLIGDQPMEELQNFSENHEIDLMVMHRPHRNFLERLFHQSMIKKTALHAPWPLLVLK